MSDIAIRVENLSKRYRIGVEQETHDSAGAAAMDFIARPFRNFRRLRSLSTFSENGHEARDVMWALRDVSFEVRTGEVVGIIGLNGAGKSTLLKILSRIVEPTRGYGTVSGRVSSLLEVGTGFHPELTGRENIYLNGSILGMTRKEIRHRFDEIVDFAGVERFIDTPVKRYSSGMKVRLAFAVAAHLEPEILLVDEVLAVGDASFQRRCLGKMENFAEGGRTVLFVSHNMPAVTRLCPRVILLDEGKVKADGPSPQVVSAYLNSGLGTTAAREWPDPARAPGGEVARLRAVRTRSEDGEVADAIDIRRPFTVEVEYDVLKPGRLLCAHLSFINEQGETAFVTIDQDPAWRRCPRPAGRFVSAVSIPGNLLAEGTLFIDAHLWAMDPDILQFSVPSAIAFQVIDGVDGDTARGDYAKTFRGVVRPLLKWNSRLVQAPTL